MLVGPGRSAPAITIDVENPVLLPGQSTVVTLWAGFDPSDLAMAIIEGDLLISLGVLGWGDALIPPAMDCCGATAGRATPAGFEDVRAMQLNGIAGFFADESNPIAFWQATYTAPQDVASPFAIELATMTTTYDVYFDLARSATQSRLADLIEGSATIHVIPAPASASLLVLGLLATRRRR